MKLTTFVSKTLCAGALLSCFAGFAQKKQPNIIFVFPDQMRGQAMGFEDEELVKTPNLDTFKQESVNFSQAIANYPVCSPTRAMIFSGMHPLKNKVILNCNNETEKFGSELPKDALCWSDILSTSGYDLGYVGKWHLDSPRPPYVKCKNNVGKKKWNEWCEPDRRHGFDYWHAYGTYDYHMHPMYWDTDAPRDGFKIYNQWGPTHEATKAIEYIENKDGNYRNNDKPFALVVSINPPHSPYDQVPEKYKNIYKDMDVEKLCDRPNIPAKGTKWGDYYRKNIKNYYACITGVDEQFGRILEALKESGIDDNTIIVFTSDHGNCIGIHDRVSKNNWFEESMRVPFMVKVPGVTNGKNVDYQLGSLDIYPTLLGLLGMSEKTPSNLKGIDYTPAITGKGKQKTVDHQWYVRMNYGPKSGGVRGIRDDRYTFVIENEKDKDQQVYLYDRQEDPYQLINIASKNKKKVRRMTSLLKKDLKKYEDPFIIR
ncbi:sulfatase [Halosquirtibacter xylanolyticus]|uniref:sulfatase family protein n=1 Tax=Halosquirtibacter xylanolyticus TaxID=3374599 RepID=UPI003747BF5D|nr:sulfatase [Prolixibacteraceae bacterium]